MEASSSTSPASPAGVLSSYLTASSGPLLSPPVAQAGGLGATSHESAMSLMRSALREKVKAAFNGLRRVIHEIHKNLLAQAALIPRKILGRRKTIAHTAEVVQQAAPLYRGIERSMDECLQRAGMLNTIVNEDVLDQVLRTGT
mmetsp:Transcript_12814/g.46869  ORF Transcript_12814/g.46869 Transcript_12814/m.46869 type:complete len:143 (+) Transcript_12814:280-708(+)